MRRIFRPYRVIILAAAPGETLPLHPEATHTFALRGFETVMVDDLKVGLLTSSLLLSFVDFHFTNLVFVSVCHEYPMEHWGSLPNDHGVRCTIRFASN